MTSLEYARQQRDRLCDDLAKARRALATAEWRAAEPDMAWPRARALEAERDEAQAHLDLVTADLALVERVIASEERVTP